MSVNTVDMRDGSSVGADELLARAVAMETRARAHRKAVAADIALADDARLDDRTRTGIQRHLQRLVDEIEQAILRLLGPYGYRGLGGTLPMLRASGLLADPALIDELLARLRLDQLGDALATHAPLDPYRPSLISRFAQHPDLAVADAARELMLAESRRRSPEMGRDGLSPAAFACLAWRVAAAMRARADTPVDAELDQRLCEAVRQLAADERELATGDLEAAAMRFAEAAAPRPDERQALLVEALHDRRIVLFTALLAHAASLDYARARAMVLDPAPERLMLALHALGLSREGKAQIGNALCEADPRRTLDALADMLDAIEPLSARQAAPVLALARLDPEYRAARIALARSATSGAA
ncbi:DUF2336 domain-containing protein [Sphingomonas sp. RS6]